MRMPLGKDTDNLANSWLRRSFGWIGDDFRRLFVLLRQREMWILIAIFCVFGVIIYYAFHLAIRYDFMLRLRNMTSDACREIGDSATAFLFFGIVFLTLTMVMVFGEFAQYLDYKRRQARRQAQSAALHCAGWGFFALLLGLAMLIFLHSQCI